MSARLDSNSKSEESCEKPAVWSLPPRLSTPLELTHLTVSMDVELLGGECSRSSDAGNRIGASTDISSSVGSELARLRAINVRDA